jgi:hypothetical protein
VPREAASKSSGRLHVSRAFATESHGLELRFLPLFFSFRVLHNCCEYL